jgi:uncharacterized membrane protein
MTRTLRRGGKGLFAAGLAAALSFGAGQAFAGVTETETRDRCTDGCRALYTRCVLQGGTDCAAQRQDCLESCL